MSEDAQHRATEFLKGLYAAGRIDEDRFDSGVAELLARAAEPGPAGAHVRHADHGSHPTTP